MQGFLRQLKIELEYMKEQGKKEVRIGETEEDRGFGRGMQYVSDYILGILSNLEEMDLE
ncbi:MAG: hypothetical protein ACQEQD_04620 [Bacillota bacterium]